MPFTVVPYIYCVSLRVFNQKLSNAYIFSCLQHICRPQYFQVMARTSSVHLRQFTYMESFSSYSSIIMELAKCLYQLNMITCFITVSGKVFLLHVSRASAAGQVGSGRWRWPSDMEVSCI